MKKIFLLSLAVTVVIAIAVYKKRKEYRRYYWALKQDMIGQICVSNHS